jgi:hypothetical protein
MAAMSAVPPVEEVHQRARQQEEKRPSGEEMRAVFGDDVIAADRQQREHEDSDEPSGRRAIAFAGCALRVLIVSVMGCHKTLPLAWRSG